MQKGARSSLKEVSEKYRAILEAFWMCHGMHSIKQGGII